MKSFIAIAVLVGSTLLQAQNAPKVSTVGAAPTSPVSGKEMYIAYCASCHGTDAKFKNAPADLTALARASGGKFPAMSVMSSVRDGAQAGHGSKEMPVWGPIFSSVSGESRAVVDQRVSNLVKYIESIQAK